MAKVVLENVRVDFPIYGAQQRSLRTAIFQRATGGLIHREGRKNERIVVRALSDVSLRIEEGDRLGLIGHNGSGKSTLLKVIAGIYEPIAGTRRVDGRVTPLFDMMPGLDLEDTGYENILTSGILLGMSRDQVERKIPEIEEFCELGEYLSLPVRTYSTGMTMRLGFALVTSLEPGVLLMDEGFGAGDLRFAERAKKRMDEFIERSPIIVLATHSEEMIKTMCNKAALMQEGRLLAFGPADEIVDQYRLMVHARDLAAAGDAAAAGILVRSDTAGAVYSEESIRDVGLADRLTRTSGAVRFTTAVAQNSAGQSKWLFQSGEIATFHFEYEVIKPVSELTIYFRLYHKADSSTGQEIVADLHEVLSYDPLQTGETGGIDLRLTNLTFIRGEFFVYVALGNRLSRNSRFYDVIDTNVDLPAFRIESEGNRADLSGHVSLAYEIRKKSPEKPLSHELAAASANS